MTSHSSRVLTRTLTIVGIAFALSTIGLATIEVGGGGHSPALIPWILVTMALALACLAAVTARKARQRRSTLH